MDILLEFWEKAKGIYTHPYLDQHEKDVRLARVMTAMEAYYNIPMFHNTEWIANNQKTYRVYLAISNMRQL